MIFKRPLLSIIVLLLIFTFIDMYTETNYPALLTVHLQSDKLAKGAEFRILQISDLHDKHFGSGESSLMRLVNRADADIAVITGDLADVRTKDFANIFDFAGQLVKAVPYVCFVPGNHEQASDEAERIYDGLRSEGVKLLFDDSFVYASKGFSANICGIDYPFEETSGFSGPLAEKQALSKAMKAINTESFTVILSHSPRIAYSAAQLPLDLILAGHTHGGQIRLPYIGSPLSLDPDILGRYDKGLFKLDSGTMLYVDGGLGTSILPVRLFDRAELTLVSVTGK